MKTLPPFPEVSLDREIRWASALLRQEGDRLAQFVAAAVRFDRAYVGDANPECLAITEEIEQEFGWSLWLLKARIVALQQCNGLEAQKAFVKSVIETTPEGGVVPYIAHYTSVRNEPTVNASRFIADMSRDIEVLEADVDLRMYLNHHLLSPVSLLPAAAGAVLRNESAGSIIDLYEALVAVCRALAAWQEPIHAVTDAVEILARQVEDKRLPPLLWWLGHDAWRVQAPPELSRATELLLAGDPEHAAGAAKEYVKTYADDPVGTLVLARATALLNTAPSVPSATGLGERLGRGMAKRATAEDTSQLRRYILNFGQRSLGATLQATLADVDRSQPYPRA